MTDVESLSRGIRAVGNVFTRRMPVGIDTEAEGLVGLGVVGSQTSLVEQQGRSMRTTDVKTHARRVGAIETVTVDTTLELRILDERCLLEIREVALVDAHLAPYLVARFDKAIAQAVVDAIGADIEVKRPIGVPPVGKLGRNCNSERIACILRHELVPVVDIEVGGLATLSVKCVALCIRNDSINQQGIVHRHAEVERSYADGDGYIDIIGIDVGQGRFIRCTTDMLATRGKEKGTKNEKNVSYNVAMRKFHELMFEGFERFEGLGC